MSASRGTSNGNSAGSAADRRARRAYLVTTFGWPAADGLPGLVCCYRCGVPMLQDEDPEAPGQSVTVDRIVPGCEGGRYTRDNIRPCCRPCNEETGGALGGRRAAASRGGRPPRAEADTEQTRALPTVRLSRSHGVLTPTGEPAGQAATKAVTPVTRQEHTRFLPPLKGGKRVPSPPRSQENRS